ncbi:MAG: O-antigen ligase family protein [Nostocales cyanobacterium 94392]|nr:O-antigen ligase family protein [Nostocales cyanobacterium 94392]
MYYQCLLAVVAVLVFFTEADNYFFDSGITPVPKNLVILMCLISTPLFISFKSNNFQYLPMGVILWCCLYLGISAASFLHNVPTELVTQELETRILAVVFILLMTLIFSGEPIVRNCARFTLFIAIFLTIFNNFRELIDPMAFNGFNITGRPAGFYKDPNKSGAALIMGLIFTIGLLPKKYRLAYFVIVFIGAFITFSRGAMLCLVILLFLLIVKRLIPISQVYSIIGFLIILLLAGNVGNYLLDQASELGILNHSIEKRIVAITNFADSDAREADDGSSRSDVASIAWRSFLKQPFLGHGIGYIREWGEILPHNMYLTFMIEHGFIGAIILPLFVLSVTRNAYGETKNISLFFGSFILIWSLFSNTVLEDRETLMMFVLLAVMSKYSRLEKLPKIPIL